MNLLKTCFESIKPYYVYVPIVSSISGLISLFSFNKTDPKSIKDRSITYIDPHEKAKVAISIIPIIGNVIVAIVDIAEKIFSQSQSDKRWDYETSDQIASLEKLNQENEKKIESLKVDFNDQQDRIRKEKDGEIDGLKDKIESYKAELADQERLLSESNKQLALLKEKISSDTNPDIIVALAEKNRVLSEEIKAKQNELEKQEARIKTLEAEKNNGYGQMAEKYRIEVETKNALLGLQVAHMQRLCRCREKLDLDLSAVFSSLATFELDNVTPEVFEYASRFNTAMAKIELYKTYLEWRISKTDRNSFLSQLQDFLGAIEQACLINERLHSRFEDKDYSDKVSSLSNLSTFVVNVIADEKIIAQGKDAIQNRIMELDPSYTPLSPEEILEMHGNLSSNKPYRIMALETALWNSVRNIDVSDLYSFMQLKDFDELQPILNEINDKKDLLNRLLLPERRSCISELRYLGELVYVASYVLGKMKLVNQDQETTYARMIELKKILQEALEDEEIISQGQNALIVERIKALDDRFEDMSVESLIDFRNSAFFEEEPFRIQVLLMALKKPG